MYVLNILVTGQNNRHDGVVNITVFSETKDNYVNKILGRLLALHCEMTSE